MAAEDQAAELQLEMSRRARVAGVSNLAVFLFVTFGSPTAAGRPKGSDLALGAMVLGTLLRAAVYEVGRRHAGDAAFLPRHRLFFRAVMMLNALTWGLLAVPTLGEYGMSAPTFILLIVILGIALLSLQNFGLDLPLVRAFIATITAPTIVMTLTSPRLAGGFTTGLSFTVYAGFLLYLSKRTHALLWETIKSRTTIQGHRDQLRAMVETFPGLFLWLDADLRVLGANRKLAAAYLTSPADCVGLALERVVTDGRLRDTIVRFAEEPAAEAIVEQEVAGIDATPRWTLLALKKAGPPAAPQLLVLAIDIEDKKRAEAERDEARASAYVSSQLAELGTMAAGIAHEINNPLQALSLGLGLLRQHLADPKLSREELVAKGTRIAERGSATVQRVATIVQSLRTFARVEEGAATEIVDVRSVVAEVEQLCAQVMTADGIALRITVPDDALLARARHVELGQVLLNLVNNARDAVLSEVTPAERRWVAVSARATGDEVELRVEDGGPGIPASLREKIMMPFFTTKGAGHGTGLGLSISRAIVERQGGRLYLDESGEATTFVVRLAKAPAQAQ